MLKFRNLGRVQQIVEEATGLEITHSYDDLAFVEHSAFLLRFDDSNADHFYCYYNTECPEEEVKSISERLDSASQKNAMKCSHAGTFTLSQVEGKDELSITFFERKSF
ncbi:MAG TPA: hypothetical protein VF857_00560 [Spirochaetota bacterium]